MRSRRPIPKWKWLRSLTAGVAGLFAGWTAGTARVKSAPDLALVMERLGDTHLAPAGQTRAHLRRLLGTRGTSLYLHITARRTPFRVVLVPAPDERISLPLDRGRLSAWSDAPAPVGAVRADVTVGAHGNATVGDGLGPGRDDVLELDDASQLDSTVVVFYVQGRGQPEYRVRCPAYLARVTVVANGREIAAGRAVDFVGGPMTFVVA
ncbi:MAG: hypothetical protein WKG32_06765 [Gemmatimonadaceae bacterium]